MAAKDGVTGPFCFPATSTPPKRRRSVIASTRPDIKRLVAEALRHSPELVDAITRQMRMHRETGHVETPAERALRHLADELREA